MGVRTRVIRALLNGLFKSMPRSIGGYASPFWRSATGSERGRLFRRNRNSTGMKDHDDHHIDMSDEALSIVSDYMYGECANAGQEAIIALWLDSIDISVGYIDDTNLLEDKHIVHDPWGNMVFNDQPYPEAVGLIIEGAYGVLADYISTLPSSGGWGL